MLGDSFAVEDKLHGVYVYLNKWVTVVGHVRKPCLLVSKSTAPMFRVQEHMQIFRGVDKVPVVVFSLKCAFATKQFALKLKLTQTETWYNNPVQISFL